MIANNHIFFKYSQVLSFQINFNMKQFDKLNNWLMNCLKLNKELQKAMHCKWNTIPWIFQRKCLNNKAINHSYYFKDKKFSKELKMIYFISFAVISARSFSSVENNNIKNSKIINLN